MAGISKAQREAREEKFKSEMRYLGTLHKQYRKKIDDATDELDNIREDVSKLMREYNKDKVKLPELLLSISLRKAKPSRRMDYDGLMSANAALYKSLIDSEIIKLVPPKRKYRLEIRKMKPTGKQIAEWEAGV